MCRRLGGNKGFQVCRAICDDGMLTDRRSGSAKQTMCFLESSLTSSPSWSPSPPRWPSNLLMHRKKSLPCSISSSRRTSQVSPSAFQSTSNRQKAWSPGESSSLRSSTSRSHLELSLKMRRNVSDLSGGSRRSGHMLSLAGCSTALVTQASFLHPWRRNMAPSRSTSCLCSLPRS